MQEQLNLQICCKISTQSHEEAYDYCEASQKRMPKLKFTELSAIKN